MARKALIVWGGWDGHQPKEVAAIFDRVLREALPRLRRAQVVVRVLARSGRGVEVGRGRRR